MLLCFVLVPSASPSGRMVRSYSQQAWVVRNRTGIMRKAKIYRYCLPMDSGVILRDNKLTERIGYIVELSDGENTGLGEVAPLLGFSLESTEETGIQLQEQAERWVAGIPVDYANMYPSVAFGLSMAQLS